MAKERILVRNAVSKLNLWMKHLGRVFPLPNNMNEYAYSCYSLPRAVIRKLYTADEATSHGVFPLRFLKFGSAPRSTSIFTNFNCPTIAASVDDARNSINSLFTIHFPQQSYRAMAYRRPIHEHLHLLQLLPKSLQHYSDRDCMLRVVASILWPNKESFKFQFAHLKRHGGVILTSKIGHIRTHSLFQ